MIKKVKSKYAIVSKEGKVLGTFATKEEATKRLREIEYFKHKGGKK